MIGLLWEVVDFVVRWVHVVAGIMWVGNSLLFNWLDRSLQKPSGTSFTKAPLGSIWLLHSGGFYHVEKTLLTGEPMPRPLHWFKWQAYTTWISGAVLLLVLYYMSDRASLADPSSSGIGAARLLGLGGVLLGWGAYEGLQRTVAAKWPRLAWAVWLLLFAAITVAFTHWLSGRAAWLHVGAMLGSIMAGNVFFTIVPSQRALVASVEQGYGVNAAVSARAKRVSIFNNYFTFPVIALMVSNHFPALYGGRFSALALWIVVVGGAAVRHVLNLRWTWAPWRPALAGAIGATVLALILVMRAPPAAPPNESAAAVAAAGPVTFADARHVIDRRCAACHSATPTDLTFGGAPAGVMFDTPAQIRARAARILDRAVTTRTMPPANKTHISAEERLVLARWIAAGAPMK